MNDEFIYTIRDEHKSVFEDGYGKMKVRRRKLHDYLQINLDYIKMSQVKFTILDYIKETLDWFEKAETKSRSTKLSAAPLNLFVVDEDYETCHKIIEKMIFT